jgi:hypothetical protein
MRYTDITKSDRNLNDSQDIPTHSQIEAIEQWQNYGSGGGTTVIQNMLTVIPTLPAYAQPYAGELYRVVGLTRFDLRKLLRTGKLTARKLECWSKSKNAVYDYLDYTYESMLLPDSVATVIFKATVSSKEGVLDLDNLWKNKEWIDRVEWFEDNNQGFDVGIDFKDSQQEVVVSRPYLRISEIIEVRESHNAKWANSAEQVAALLAHLAL